MALILASESPRRRALLAASGVGFTAESACVAELADDVQPRRLPERNAELKASAVAAKHPGAAVLGADTVILFDNRIIGKPADLNEALTTLLELAGKTHEVITGVALIRIAPPLRRVWSETTRVRFKPFDETVARRYLDLVDVLDKAGAYALQEHGDMLIESVCGDADNVVGLPTARVVKMLEDEGLL